MEDASVSFPSSVAAYATMFKLEGSCPAVAAFNMEGSVSRSGFLVLSCGWILGSDRFAAGDPGVGLMRFLGWVWMVRGGRT